MGDVEGSAGPGARVGIVGRDEVLARVLAVPIGVATVIVAAPGAGASTLLDAIAAHLASGGGDVARVQGIDVAAPPCSAIAHLLRWPVPTGDDAVRAAADDLAGEPGGRRVVVVDDADRLDPTSSAVIRAVAAGGRARIVAAGGPGVAAGWVRAERIDLEPLAPSALERLVEEAVGGPVDGGVRSDLVARAGGDVALLRALVEGALASDALRFGAGVWSPRRPIVAGPAVHDLVAERLRSLTPDEREAAELLALTGPVRVEVADPGTGGAALESLERRGIVVAEADRAGQVRVALAVPVVADVLAAGVALLRRRRRCGEAADALEALDAAGQAGRRDRLQRTRLALEAGRTIGLEEALAGAHDAARRFDPVWTERLAIAALEAGAGFEAELLLARANAHQGDPTGADARLVALLASAEDDAQRVAATMLRAELLVFFQADAASAIAALEAVEPEIADPHGRRRLVAKRGLLLHSIGDSVGALRLLEPLLDDLEGDALLLACFAVATGATLVGRVSLALDACDRAEAAAPTGWDPMLVELSRLAALGLLGDVDDAVALARQRYDDAVAEGATHRQAWFAWARGGLLLNQGRAAEAARWCAESRALLIELGQRPAERLVANDLARALALLGRPEEAEEVLAATDGGADEHRPGLFGDDLVRLVTEGWIAAARNDLVAARERLAAAARGYEARRHDYPALHAWADVARLGDPTTVVADVRRLAATVEGDLAAAQTALVEASCHHAAGPLEAAGAHLEGLGRLLLAAEAYAGAAARHERAGEPRRASAAARRSADLVARCGGVRTPALGGAAEAPLSTREREVALMAAAGRTNRAIADALVLSVRTVETHLQRSYVKLGITRREELAGALGPGIRSDQDRVGDGLPPGSPPPTTDPRWVVT